MNKMHPILRFLKSHIDDAKRQEVYSPTECHKYTNKEGNVYDIPEIYIIPQCGFRFFIEDGKVYLHHLGSEHCTEIIDDDMNVKLRNDKLYIFKCYDEIERDRKHKRKNEKNIS